MTQLTEKPNLFCLRLANVLLWFGSLEIAMRNSRTLVVAILTLVFSTLLFAEPRRAFVEGTQEEVFTAVLKVAQADWSVTFADRPTGMISFNTGTSFTSNGMECSVVVQKLAEGRAQISIKTQKKNGQVIAWGAGDRIADKLLKGVSAELGPNHAMQRAPEPVLPDDAADTHFK